MYVIQVRDPVSVRAPNVLASDARRHTELRHAAEWRCLPPDPDPPMTGRMREYNVLSQLLRHILLPFFPASTTGRENVENVFHFLSPWI